ncbi:Na+/H+ antiporter [Pseudomonas matsuisoli]|uniref:Na+/H+ antiporter n=1 Tax=Pseudomonas matsuisoli TaxID=1515666 RepID=A0A917UXS0_9PSED|nr:Na+/H+ antiporter [Pseudomonas matsuisoli]GGJ93935.1 Na+/H+ antiporter [Pseudomonas matsuisoli]
METITLVLVMLIAVIISSTLVRMLPFPLPLPLLQIALGAAIGMVSGWRLELDPEVFFLIFLPPLLFLDGWRIPKEGLLRDKEMILALALGLVIFTVVGVGYFIHLLIPSMPMPVAFALAAVISPTDPVAVSAIAKRVPIPKRLMHVLEGESLLNDASGLVCLRFAIAATLTGTFSASEAAINFVQLALGGIAIGVAVTWGITRLKEWTSRRFGEETGAQILISLLIPFLAYLAAEHLHCSGILAAVAAGISMSYTELSGRALAVTRVRRTAVWDVLQFALNGMIFVLLGEQLPGIIAGASQVVRETGYHEPIWLVLYIVVINLALGALRFAWVWLSIRFTLYRRRAEAPRSLWRVAATTSVAGARGAITLAGVLTLPLVMNDGTPFPARDLAILLAAGVIIMSLVVASVFMPILLKNGLDLPAEPEHQSEMDRARDIAARAAIRAIEKATHDMSEGRPDADRYIEAAGRISDLYRYRIDNRAKPDEDEDRQNAAKTEEIERQLRLAGLRAERDELFRMVRRKRLEEEVARKLIREIDLMEAQQSG